MTKNNELNTYLSFYLGKDLFAANVGNILEVLRNEKITEIPRSKEFIKGIINFRGDIVTVIDIFRKVSLPNAITEDNKTIVVFELKLNDKQVKIGVLVSKVKKVFEINNNEQYPIPEFGKYYNPDFLIGVTKLDNQFVMILNLAKILNDEEVNIILEKNKD